MILIISYQFLPLWLPSYVEDSDRTLGNSRSISVPMDGRESLMTSSRSFFSPRSIDTRNSSLYQHRHYDVEVDSSDAYGMSPAPPAPQTGFKQLAQIQRFIGRRKSQRSDDTFTARMNFKAWSTGAGMHGILFLFSPNH